MKKEKQISKLEGQTRLKWVKKAQHWCTTTWKDGHQIQTWTQEKPVV